jgi:hypothetical protein
MAEWSRSDLPYLARARDLLYGGGLNGSTVLDSATFHSNGGGNTMTGGAGLDLFYGLLPGGATERRRPFPTGQPSPTDTHRRAAQVCPRVRAATPTT